ncbi:uncharacterized protein NEMAJ01_0922 [Nematocida major]|uniref:uncharacterized protein n=1 Tax=Nematocida major TaxID=1912982 RepID=UPI0020085CF5|nr:uncharacterized protein NEMAJ01_0922 [Nematocida major]KAH9386026.1 hypothetical protein NEMAJ01_0922 [Nematocida major]
MRKDGAAKIAHIVAAILFAVSEICSTKEKETSMEITHAIAMKNEAEAVAKEKAKEIYLEEIERETLHALGDIPDRVARKIISSPVKTGKLFQTLSCLDSAVEKAHEILENIQVIECMQTLHILQSILERSKKLCIECEALADLKLSSAKENLSVLVYDAWIRKRLKSHKLQLLQITAAAELFSCTPADAKGKDAGVKDRIHAIVCKHSEKDIHIACKLNMHLSAIASSCVQKRKETFKKLYVDAHRLESAYTALREQLKDKKGGHPENGCLDLMWHLKSRALEETKNGFLKTLSKYGSS